jgi:hypothetical protein
LLLLRQLASHHTTPLTAPRYSPPRSGALSLFTPDNQLQHSVSWTDAAPGDEWHVQPDGNYAFYPAGKTVWDILTADARFSMLVDAMKVGMAVAWLSTAVLAMYNRPRASLRFWAAWLHCPHISLLLH